MSFLSPEFAYVALLFFPIYWLLVRRPLIQKLFLLASSYALYATWSLKVAGFLVAYSTCIWLLGLWIERNQAVATRLQLAVSLVFALSLLFFTKYYDFFRESLFPLFSHLGLQFLLPVIDVVAPIGISFFTFQAVSFLVWKKRAVCSVSCLDVHLYLSFWPTLFAGPIMRAEDFHAQLSSESFGKPLQALKAIYFIFLGLFQKMVFATWLASHYVDPLFKYPQDFYAVDSLNGILAYALQIFLDFAGYTLIVTGFGLLLGFVLPRNFAQPYLAPNVKEFWRRWHISLSSFIRDFVYIPLGGNRRGIVWSQCNIFVAMVISGLWHGVGLGFLLWGVIHGVAMVFANLFQRFASIQFPRVLGQCITFVFVSFAWVFFRASSLDNAFQVLARLATPLGTFQISWLYLWLFTGVFMALSKYALTIEESILKALENMQWWLLVLVLCLLGYLLITFSPEGVPSFIYYQF